MKRNFDTGKKLLVAAILLSVNLVIQLFAVAETVDITDGVHFLGSSLTNTVSYILTAVSMIIVLQEFFQIKTKMRGLMALNTLLEKTPRPTTVTSGIEKPEILKSPLMIGAKDSLETVISENDTQTGLVIDDESEFDSLLDELDKEDAFDEVPGNPSLPPLGDDIMNRYRTTKLKIDDETGEVEPLMDDGGLQDLIEQADLATEEEQQLAKIVAESEIIQTLNELESIVQELKAKKAA